MMAFTSPEDMMKNLPRAMASISKAMGGGGPLSDSPIFKIIMRKYEDRDRNQEIRQQQWEIDITTRLECSV
jgi:hypothetical protein